MRFANNKAAQPQSVTIVNGIKYNSQGRMLPQAFTKSQLAKLYNIKGETLNRWIAKDEDCLDALAEVGYIPACQKHFTPRQVAVIFDFLGEP